MKPSCPTWWNYTDAPLRRPNLPAWLNLSLLQDQETELAFAPGLLTAVGIFGALIAIAVLLFYRRGKRRLTYA